MPEDTSPGSPELWLAAEGEDEQHFPRRASGEAAGARTETAAGELDLRAEPFRWHSRGREGAGMYILARRCYSPRIALWSIAALAILPVHAIYAGFVLRESLVAPTSILAVWTLCEVFNAEPNERAEEGAPAAAWQCRRKRTLSSAFWISRVSAHRNLRSVIGDKPHRAVKCSR